MSANTISSRTYRDELRSNVLQETLYTATVIEAIADIDRSGLKKIENPYASVPTIVIQTTAGTYTPAAYTTTDDSLNVTQELIVAEQIYDFESSLTDVNMFMERQKRMSRNIAVALDKQAISDVLATSSISTLAVTAGFASYGVLKALGGLQGLVAGYANGLNDVFMVIESTDIQPFIQAQVSNGFNMADMALKNGFMGNYLGVDIYVVRSGVSPSAHRLAGIKKRFTVALPTQWKWEEKGVSGKTGKEVVLYGYYGSKVWNNNLPLIVDVQLT